GGGRLSSLVLDADGSPRIAFLHVLSSDLRYASGAIELSTPATAVVWPVGANRVVRWDGTGLADLSISTDGGASFQTIAPGISGGAYTLLVPRSPSTQCRIRVQRPLPYRGGNLTISFASSGGPGGTSAPAVVALYDVRGRLVRTIVRGGYPSGFQSAGWNGKDDGGRRVASGIYFLKSASGGHEETIKISVLR